MTDDLKQPLPVAGYTAQPDAKIALVNEFKQDEERLLRKLDGLNEMIDSVGLVSFPPGKSSYPDQIAKMKAREDDAPDPRWVAIARSHFEQGFMALNRSVFRPRRIKLPEDSK
jgi:hypothetical protein